MNIVIIYIIYSKLKPIPRSPSPDAMVAVGKIEVPEAAAVKIKAAPLVTIGNTTKM